MKISVHKKSPFYKGASFACLYLLGWCGAIFLAYLNFKTLALLPSLAALAICFMLGFFYDRFGAWVDMLYALFNLIIGFFLEYALLKTGAISYINEKDLAVPLWVLALYPLFAVFLHHNFDFLKKKLLFGFFTGALGGAYLYYGCQKLHLVDVHFYSVAALLWGLYFVVALYMSLDFINGEKKVIQDKSKKKMFTVLYDGGCKICDREICSLKKLENKEGIEFIDIQSKDYDPYKFRGISKDVAMKALHGFFDDEPILQGTKTLSVLYARTHKSCLAFFLNLRSLAPLLRNGYKIFAKYRYIFRKKS